MAEKSIFRLPAKRNYNESLNYEDRIIANVVRKKIAALVDKAVKNDVKITSKYFDDRELAIFGEILRLNDLNELNINAWADPDGNAVNIPITPTLLNLAATAEELAHLKAYSKEVLDAHNIDDYEGIQRNYRENLIEQELIFAEEVRAKNIADKTVGGYLPKTARITSAFRNDYAYSFLRALQEYAPEKIPEMMEKYPDLKNAKDIYDPEAIEYEKKIKEKMESYERWVNKAMPDYFEANIRFPNEVSYAGQEEGFDGLKAAEFMEGVNSNMTDRNSELFSTILPDFETKGGDRSSLSPDKEYTRGTYHITLQNAKNLARNYPNSDVAKIYNDFNEPNKRKSYNERKMAWGNYMFQNEQDEQTVANLLMEDNNNSLAGMGVDTLGLTDGEYNGLHLFMWNAGAPSTKKAIVGTFDRLSKFRRILREDPNHPHKEEIEAHIKTLQYAAASSLLRTGKTLQAGHFIRDAVSRALVYDGRYISKEERAKIDGQTALSNGMEAHRKGQAVLGKYNEFERLYNYFNMTKRIPTPPPKPAEPFKPQVASAPTFEEVSPGPPPQQPIAPGIVTGVTEEPEEVIGLEAPVAPSLAKGDMQ